MLKSRFSPAKADDGAHAAPAARMGSAHSSAARFRHRARRNWGDQITNGHMRKLCVEHTAMGSGKRAAYLLENNIKEQNNETAKRVDSIGVARRR